MADSQRKEIRDFFKALTDYEDSVLKYVSSEASSAGFAHSFLDTTVMSALKAEILAKRTENSSFTEAACLEVIFKFDSVKRDLDIRKKRRSDYYADAPSDFDNEKTRLGASNTYSIQSYSGNTKIQKGLST